MIYVDTEVCEGCGLCVEACPHDALKLENGKAFAIQGLCHDEGRCVEVCPNQALMSVFEPEESRIQPGPVKVVTPIAEPAPPPARRPATMSTWIGAALGFFVSDILPEITYRWREGLLLRSRSGDPERVREERRCRPRMPMGDGRSRGGRKLRRRRWKGRCS